MANFPNSAPSFTPLDGTSTTTSVPHWQMHQLENDEIVAVAEKIGTGASTPTTEVSALITDGDGTSSWGKVSSQHIDTELQNGWIEITETWTYSTVSTIFGTVTVATGAASRYQKGDSIRFKQGGAYKYFSITDIPSTTTIKFSGGTDYTLTNAAITDVWISRAQSPFGFPKKFDTSVGAFYMMGRIKVEYGSKSVSIANGTATSSTPSDLVTFAIPFADVAYHFSTSGADTNAYATTNETPYTAYLDKSTSSIRARLFTREGNVAADRACLVYWRAEGII